MHGRGGRAGGAVGLFGSLVQGFSGFRVQRARLHATPNLAPGARAQGAQDLVTAVACMGGTGGQVALSGGRDGCIALWDARSGAQVATLAHRFGGPMPDNGAMVRAALCTRTHGQ